MQPTLYGSIEQEHEQQLWQWYWHLHLVTTAAAYASSMFCACCAWQERRALTFLLVQFFCAMLSFWGEEKVKGAVSFLLALFRTCISFSYDPADSVCVCACMNECMQAHRCVLVSVIQMQNVYNMNHHRYHLHILE